MLRSRPMGARPWIVRGPWRESIAEALSETRERVFREGSYTPVPGRSFATLGDLDAFFMREPDVDDEGRRIARPGDDLSDDEPDLHPVAYFLLRRGPIVAALLVAIFLFVLTAYATTGRTPTKAPITDPRAVCVETPAEPCTSGP